MTVHPPESTGRSTWPLPSRNDELAMALLIVLALSGGMAALAFYSRGNPLVDLDALQSQPIELQIDLQTVTWPELTLIPGIGEKLAKRIVASRESEGPFADPNELTRVHGIGPVILEQIKPFLRSARTASDGMTESAKIAP